MDDNPWRNEKVYTGYRWTDDKNRVITHRVAKPNAAFIPAILLQNNYSVKILPPKWIELQHIQKLNGPKMTRFEIVSLAQEMIKVYFVYASGADIIWLSSSSTAKMQLSGALDLGYDAAILAGSVKDPLRIIQWVNPVTGEKRDNDQLVWVQNMRNKTEKQNGSNKHI